MCLPAVRGFRASMSRSTRRLKAMAALRAVTMHARMPSRFTQENPCRPQASVAAERANGSAKSVWLKRIRPRYLEIVSEIN